MLLRTGLSEVVRVPYALFPFTIRLRNHVGLQFVHRKLWI